MTAPAVSRGTRAGLTVVRPAATFDEIRLELVDVEDNVRVDVGELTELAASIDELGVIQPIKVTAQPDGRFRVVWGQRRVLACRLLELVTIPAVIEPASDVDRRGARRSIEQLSENLQRKDLNPIEEAVALREVLDADKTLTQEALADKLGMSRPWVSNTLGLLEAAPAVQVMVREGQLTASHVKALRGLAPSTQLELAERAVKQGASAHNLEDMVQQHKRSEEWRKEREDQSRRDAAERTVRYAASIEKKLGKEPRDVKIVVSRYGMGDATVAVKALEKAGLTNVTLAQAGVASRPKGGVCNCVGWKVETTYQGLVIAPGCFEGKHQRALHDAEEAERQAGYRLQSRVQDHLKTQIGSLVGSSPLGQQRIHLSPTAARIALWNALGYQVSDWAVARGGKRNSPWASIVALDEEQLAAELGKILADHFRDNYGYHVDWPAIATELGVPVEEPKPEPKPKHPRRRPPAEAPTA